MRLVLDTHTALSGLLWGGPPGRIIDAADSGRVRLASSASLLAELHGVLHRGAFGNQADWIDAAIRRAMHCVEHAGLDVRLVG